MANPPTQDLASLGMIPGMIPVDFISQPGKKAGSIVIEDNFVCDQDGSSLKNLLAVYKCLESRDNRAYVWWEMLVCPPSN